MKKFAAIFLSAILFVTLNSKSSFAQSEETSYSTVTSEEFKEELNILLDRYYYSNHLEGSYAEEDYLVDLSNLTKKIANNQELKEFIYDLELKKEKKKCKWCANIIEDIGYNYLLRFGLDGYNDHRIGAHFEYIPPQGKMPLHNHPNQNGVLLILKGELRSVNFDFISSPSMSSVQIKKTKDTLLNSGKISSFGAYKDNLHELYAGNEGVIFLSIYTAIPNITESIPLGELERGKALISDEDLNEYFEAY